MKVSLSKSIRSKNKLQTDLQVVILRACYIHHYTVVISTDNNITCVFLCAGVSCAHADTCRHDSDVTGSVRSRAKCVPSALRHGSPGNLSRSDRCSRSGDPSSGMAYSPVAFVRTCSRYPYNDARLKDCLSHTSSSPYHCAHCARRCLAPGNSEALILLTGKISVIGTRKTRA
jgi:hypothetical protein